MSISRRHSYQDYCSKLGINDDLVVAVLAGKYIQVLSLIPGLRICLLMALKSLETMLYRIAGNIGPKRRFSHYSGLKFGGMVRYRHTYMHAEKFLADFNFGGLKAYRQTAKFNSPPNFPAIRQFNMSMLIILSVLHFTSYTQLLKVPHSTMIYGLRLSMIY